MPNERNLVPNEARTPKERRANAIKAGKASGEARRNKRDAQGAARLILDMGVTSQLNDTLNKMDIAAEDRTNLVAVMSRLVLAAQAGNVQAARLLLEASGYLNNRSENNISVNVNSEDDVIQIFIPYDGRNPLP